MGRPSNYNQAIVDIICERMAEGESIRQICKDADMPGQSTIYKWLDAHPDFVEQYARARELQADFYADQCIQIADDGLNDTYIDENGNKRTDQDVIARSRLRVDVRKWHASKLAPKKYGDKMAVTDGDGKPLQMLPPVFNVTVTGK